MIPIYDSDLSALSHQIADLQASLASQDAELRAHSPKLEQCYQRLREANLSIAVCSFRSSYHHMAFCLNIHDRSTPAAL